MAASKSTKVVEGFTRFTKGNTTTYPSGIVFQDSDGYDWYLWIDTTGDLRTTDAETAEAAGFNWLTGGTVVGGQS